jgi:hypothetical protein
MRHNSNKFVEAYSLCPACTKPLVGCCPSGVMKLCLLILFNPFYNIIKIVHNKIENNSIVWKQRLHISLI